MTTCCRGGEEILKYDRVLLNAGDGLNPDTGVFSCPAPGTYMFIIHIATHKDKVTSHLVILSLAVFPVLLPSLSLIRSIMTRSANEPSVVTI